MKKVIAELKKMSRKEPVKYAKFLENYGQTLKEGIHYEPELKENIAEVLTFKSLLEDSEVSLDDYIEKNCSTPEKECCKKDKVSEKDDTKEEVKEVREG